MHERNTALTREEIEAVVINAVAVANQSRPPDLQLRVGGDAPIFGPDSTLDSLGLVALLIDIEEAFEQRGCSISLSDERAMSQRRSPFRDVPTLVAYIERLVN